MKSFWIGIFLCAGVAAYGQGFDYNAIHGGISKDKVDESKLQWGPEVKGVKAAVEIGTLKQADGKSVIPIATGIAGNSTDIPLLFHVKNGSDKTIVTYVFGSFWGIQFYTVGGDGKLIEIESNHTSSKYHAGSGAVESIKPGEVLTFEVGFPVAWASEAKGGLVAGIDSLNSEWAGGVFSQAVKIEPPVPQKPALTVMDVLDPPYTLADLRIPNDKPTPNVHTVDTAALVSFFCGGSMDTATYVTIRRDGKRSEMMFNPMAVRGGMDKSPVGAPMPEAQRVPLYAALNSLPESQPPKDDANAFLVSWDDGGKWTTRIYDRTHLPPEASQLVKVMGIPEPWL